MRLKFIGDGLLAIFPLAAFEGIADAAMNAMAAAHEVLRHRSEIRCNKQKEN